MTNIAVLAQLLSWNFHPSPPMDFEDRPKNYKLNKLYFNLFLHYLSFTQIYLAHVT